MKIIIFTAYFYPHKGGVENYVRDLFLRINAEKIIITSNTENAPAYEEWNDFKIYRLECWHLLGKRYPVIKPSEFHKIDNLMNIKPDFIITNTRFFHLSFLGARFAQKYNIPYIHIEHGTMHSQIKNPLFRFGGMLYDHTFGRYIIKNAWKTAGISNASQKFIRHIYNRNTVLMRNAIDVRKFYFERKIFDRKKKSIIYVGRLIYAKGVQDLLSVLKDFNVNIWIVGDGDYRQKLMKINSKAKFLGIKNSDEIAKLLSKADIFVNPSYSEGIPTSVLEAGASGLPIIATDVGGTREIIKDGENGFLIKPKDTEMLRAKIKILLENEALCRKFSKNIQSKIIREFDWKKTRNVFFDIIK